MANKEQKILYPKMTRIEWGAVEEKVDGSNICFKVNDDGMFELYSRKRKINQPTEEEIEKHKNGELKDFFKIAYIELENHFKEIKTTMNVELPRGVEFYAELVGQAQIKYGIEDNPVIERLFLFDVKGLTGFLKRSAVEHYSKRLGLKVVPLTTPDEKYSRINRSVLREGYVLKDRNNRFKFVERKVEGGVVKPKSLWTLTKVKTEDDYTTEQVEKFEEKLNGE